MSKVIALQSHTGALAKYLSEHGYRVVDYDTIHRPGIKVDAILCTGYHPDMVTSHSSLTERVDISLGNIRHDFIDDHVLPVNVNITGMAPEQVKNSLDQALHRHVHYRT